MEFKCKVVAWYIENLESHKDTPNIPATSLQNLATKVGIDRRTVSRWGGGTVPQQGSHFQIKT